MFEDPFILPKQHMETLMQVKVVLLFLIYIAAKITSLWSGTEIQQSVYLSPKIKLSLLERKNHN